VDFMIDLNLSKPEPVYKQFEQALRGAIVSRRLAPGSRLPKEVDMAHKASLSRGTVRRALAKLEKEGLVVRRKGHGTYVAGADNIGVVPLAVIIEDGGQATSGFGGQVVQAMTKAAARFKAEILLRERSDAEGVTEPAAVIFLMPRNNEEVQKAAASGKPVVAVDYAVRLAGVDSVVYDNVGASLAAVRHLISLGHRRIGYIDAQIHRDGRFITETNSLLRLEGYRQALHEARIASEFVWPMPLDDKDIRRELPGLLRGDGRPTAIFAFDESVALGVWMAAMDLGLNIPADLSVATLRILDQSPLGGIDWTGAGVTVRELGEAAVAQAIAGIEKRTVKSMDGKDGVPGPEVIVLPYRWVPGETCAPPCDSKHT